jgi:hypothetical protein
MATNESVERAREDAATIERDASRAWDHGEPVNEGEIQKLMALRGLSRADAIEYLCGLRDGRASARGDSRNTYRQDG